MTYAEWLCWLATGLFFLSGLLTGVWKYVEINRSDNGRAHYYVDIAHRTSLMYSFSCVVLAGFASRSAWSDSVNTWAAAGPILFFALAVGGYIVHGFLKDTTNQMKKPHKLGHYSIPNKIMSTFMWLLVLFEIGGFMVLFLGFLSAY